MKAYVGVVETNTDPSRSGEFKARFPKLFDGEAQWVTYTSPSYQVNAGGIVSIPQFGDQIIALYNEDLLPGEALLYYHSTIVKAKSIASDKEFNPNVDVLRSSDPKAQYYNDKDQPVTQTFTNSVGAGLIIQRDFSENKISNNVTLKSETGDEVNVGALGFQVRNAQGDSIVLTGSNPNDSYAAQSFSVETESGQEYKCMSSDIKIKIIDGGDINILNDSTGSFGLDGVGGKWSGNIRLKSKERNIDLAALGEESHVNIITQGATIQVDSQGTVKISSVSNIQFESAQSINLNATQGVNIFGGNGVQIGSNGSVNANGSVVNLNGTPVTFLPKSASKDDRAQPVSPATGSPPVGVQLVPNDYFDPTGIGPGGIEI